MPDAITDLGQFAAACELEAFLSPWDRAELELRAEAYRGEQRRLLAQLPYPAGWKSTAASAQLKEFGSRVLERASSEAAAGCSRRM